MLQVTKYFSRAGLSQSENNKMEKNSKKQLLQRWNTNLSISPPFSSNLWGLFILIQIIVLISSPNSLSSHCVGQKLSDILMSAPKMAPDSHTAQHGAWQGLYRVMWSPWTWAHFQRIFTLPFTTHRIWPHICNPESLLQHQSVSDACVRYLSLTCLLFLCTFAKLQFFFVCFITVASITVLGLFILCLTIEVREVNKHSHRYHCPYW